MNFQFGLGKLVFKDALGNSLVAGAVQEFSTDYSQDIKEMHGENKDALAIAGGKRKVTGKFKLGAYDLKVLNALFFNGSVTTGSERLGKDKVLADATITVTNAGDFLEDLGVSTADGFQFKLVTTSPAIGEYSVNTTTGVYTFNASQTGYVTILYKYSATTGQKYTIDTELMGDLNTFEVHLFTTYGGQNICKKYHKVTVTKFSEQIKNDDFVYSDFDFQLSVNNEGELFDVSVY